MRSPLPRSDAQRAIPRDALGLGLRVPHYDAVRRDRPSVDYLELISENFLTVGTPARECAREVGGHYPIALHGVGLNLLGHEALDETYIDSVRSLADELDAAFVSDHLCWSKSHAMTHHDLLPAPFTNAIADYAAERAAYVQERIGRPFALENLSSYVEFRESTMAEWDFYARVVESAGVLYMLDLNNVFVSSVNHDFDPLRYLDAVDFAKVAQVHLAGHETLPSGLIVDTHDRSIADAVWRLYAEAWRRAGPFPTLVEWDAAIPPLDAMLSELDKARGVRG